MFQYPQSEEEESQCIGGGGGAFQEESALAQGQKQTAQQVILGPVSDVECHPEKDVVIQSREGQDAKQEAFEGKARIQSL